MMLYDKNAGLDFQTLAEEQMIALLHINCLVTGNAQIEASDDQRGVLLKDLFRLKKIVSFLEVKSICLKSPLRNSIRSLTGNNIVAFINSNSTDIITLQNL
jgi:hypothetical protein